MDKDLLHKIFVSLREVKQVLYAKSFQVNDTWKPSSPRWKRTSKTSNVTWKTGHVTSSSSRFAVNSDLKLSNNNVAQPRRQLRRKRNLEINV